MGGFISTRMDWRVQSLSILMGFEILKVHVLPSWALSPTMPQLPAHSRTFWSIPVVGSLPFSLEWKWELVTCHWVIWGMPFRLICILGCGMTDFSVMPLTLTQQLGGLVVAFCNCNKVLAKAGLVKYFTPKLTTMSSSFLDWFTLLTSRQDINLSFSDTTNKVKLRHNLRSSQPGKGERKRRNLWCFLSCLSVQFYWSPNFLGT